MCIGPGEAKAIEDEDIIATQEHILHAYNVWKQGFEWALPDETYKEYSEEEIVDCFLSDMKELILDRG